MESLFDRAAEQGALLWVSATSLPTLDDVARRALKNAGMEPAEFDNAVKGAMESLCRRRSVLTNFGYQQAEVYRNARDFEDAQLATSSHVFTGGETRIVTREKSFDSGGYAPSITPEQAVNWLDGKEVGSARPIQFNDLAAQQDRIRPELERNIYRMLHHGKYILGPEIQELEEKLQEHVGAIRG